MSEKSDVYSFGVMFWEMLTQNWPFVDLITTESYTELFSIILSGKRPSLKGVCAFRPLDCLIPFRLSLNWLTLLKSAGNQIRKSALVLVKL